jgi:hypothetical protein
MDLHQQKEKQKQKKNQKHTNTSQELLSQELQTVVVLDNLDWYDEVHQYTQVRT